MKKILISISTVAFLGVLVLGATSAFFSDTEVSENNVFTAGSVTLDLGDITHVYQDNQDDPVDGYFSTPGGTSFALNDLKPLDWGNIAFQLENGDNEAHICAMVTGDPDENLNEASEALYDLLNFYSTDDGSQVVPGNWFSLGIADSNSPVETGVDYCFGDATTDEDGLVSCDHGGITNYNDAQNGSFSADLMFYAIQTRNNEDFSCDQLTIDETTGEPVYTPETQPTIGAQVALYTTPECTNTVSNNVTIQSVVDVAGENAIICVDNGTYTENVVTTNSGQTIVAKNPQGATIDGGVRMLNEGTTLQGFVVTGTTDTAGVGGDGYGIYTSNNNVQVLNNEVVASFGLISNTQGVMSSIGANNVVISNNVISGFHAGIFMNPTTNSTISYNNLTGNNVGSANDGPENNTVFRNVFSGNSVESLGYDGDAVSGTGNNGSITITENNFSGGPIERYGTTPLVIENNWLDGGVVLNNVTHNSPATSAFPTY